MTIWAIAIFLIISSKSVGAEETHLLYLEPKNGSVRLGDGFKFSLTVRDPLAKGIVEFKNKGSTATFCALQLGTGIQIMNIIEYTCDSEVSEDGTIRYYLQIENVSLNDSGNWYCQLGMYTSNNVFLDVKSPPTVQIKPYEPCTGLTFMDEEKNLTLDCQVVSGNPKPSSFQWYQNLNLVGQEQRYTINRVRRNSGGLYRCVANNSVAPDGEDSVNVTVHYRPTITLKEVDYVFNETTDQTITCTADANPPAEITWTKPWIGAVISTSGGILSLKNLNGKDSGTYTCIARNTVTRCDGTKTTKTAHMNVKVEVQYAPTITVFDHQTNITVKEKEQVKLRCEADSNPPPTLTIQKSKGHNPVIKNQHSEVRNLTYVFTAECNSSGTYVCSARNSLGNKSSREVRVNVKCQPRPANSTKLIYAGVRGNDVNMTVSVISYPKPVFMLQNSSGHVLDRDQDPDYDGYLATGSTTLRISQNSDFGNYSIVVNNTEGEFVFTATIRAQSKPDPPVNLKVSRVTSRSLSLSWEGGFNGGSLQNFTVLYRPEGGKWRRHQTTLLEGDDNHDLHLDISDLEPDTKYQINLSAANTHGSSISSVEAKTKGEITLALYGGAAGGSVMVLIGIIVIVVIVVRRKGKTKDGMQGNDDDEAVIQDNIIYASSSDLHGSPKVDNPAFADEAIMQDNDLYATSGNQNGAAKGDNSNDVYAVVKKVMGKEDSVYAVPQKKKCGKEKEKSMGKGKGKGKGKGIAVKTAKGETTRDGDEDDAYSNVDKENKAVKVGRDSDGLLYTTVDFSSKPTSDVIIGAENSSTVYTTVEFNPKPRQSEEGEKE